MTRAAGRCDEAILEWHGLHQRRCDPGISKIASPKGTAGNDTWIEHGEHCHLSTILRRFNGHTRK
jgi:hypothetical protein